MQCNTCRNEAIFFQPVSGRHLCGRHLVSDIEARAKRSIRSHHWINTGDHIAVVLTGDKKSAALLRFFQKLVAGRRDIRLSALPAGSEGTGRNGPEAARRVAESLGVSCTGPRPGSRDGDFGGERITRLARAFTLDDIAQVVLVQFLAGDAGELIHPLLAGSSGVPLICPFIAVPSEEADIYWDLEGTGIDLAPSTPATDPLSRDVEALFRSYWQRHPATGHALLNLAEDLSSCRVDGIAAAAIRQDGAIRAGRVTEVTGNGA
jgi:tRNA(Ile)-lysidine synthase TilS/MesJ